MSWWMILLIVGVVAMAVGPVMLMQPNKAQRYQEHIRSRAMQLGLRVSMQSLPTQPADTMPVYYLPRQPARAPGDWLLVRSSFAHEVHLNGYWAWQGTQRANPGELLWLNQVLPQLPPSVSALSASSMGIGAFWSEQGGEKTLLLIQGFLKTYPGADKE